MFILRLLSLKLLYLEAIFVMMVSIPICISVFLAIFVGFSAPIPVAFERKIVLLLASLAFVSFWNILLNIGQEKYANGKKVNQVTLILASLGAFLTIAVITHVTSLKVFELFLLGTYFLPTYLHVLLEIRRQQIENKRFKSISNQI